MSVLFTKRSASVLKSSPWINGLIHSLKRSCRKPEHLWRKSRLQVHLIYVKDILVSFTNSVRETRAACSPVWFLKAQAILRFCLTLLITLLPLLHLLFPCHLTSTVKIKKKITHIRNNLSLSAVHFCPSSACKFRSFYTCFSSWTNPVGSVKVCCCLDILPASLFKDVFRSISPHIVNSSLASSQVPIYFKNAVSHPILKKPH